MGTRPETANGCAFALTIAAIAARYAAWLSYSGSEPRLLGLLGVCGVFPETLCSTSNSDTLCVRGTGRSGYRLGVGEDMFDIALEMVARGIAVTCTSGEWFAEVVGDGYEGYRRRTWARESSQIAGETTKDVPGGG